MSRQISDDPIIKSAERTGYAPWNQPDAIECPVCGSDNPEDIYIGIWGDVVGCSDCVRREDPADYYERMNRE
jgi:hypothetical protein